MTISTEVDRELLAVIYSLPLGESMDAVPMLGYYGRTWAEYEAENADYIEAAKASGHQITHEGEKVMICRWTLIDMATWLSVHLRVELNLVVDLGLRSINRTKDSNHG